MGLLGGLGGGGQTAGGGADGVVAELVEPEGLQRIGTVGGEPVAVAVVAVHWIRDSGMHFRSLLDSKGEMKLCIGTLWTVMLRKLACVSVRKFTVAFDVSCEHTKAAITASSGG